MAEDTKVTPRRYVVEKIEKFEDDLNGERKTGIAFAAIGSLTAAVLAFDVINDEILRQVLLPIDKFSCCISWILFLVSKINQASYRNRIDELETTLDLDEIAKAGRK